MNRTAKTIICIVCAAVILWSVMFLTDLTLVRNGGEPVFVIAFATADDGGSGTYLGLGYTAEIYKHLDVDHGVITDGVYLRMFGRYIAGWMTTQPDIG